MFIKGITDKMSNKISCKHYAGHGVIRSGIQGLMMMLDRRDQGIGKLPFLQQPSSDGRMIHSQFFLFSGPMGSLSNSAFFNHLGVFFIQSVRQNNFPIS
jgi:hypothetical protein